MKRAIAGIGALVLAAGIGSTVQASPYSDAVNALGPDAYWRMQDTSGNGIDQVGNAHPLGDFNGITRGSAGPSLAGMESNQLAYLFTGPNAAYTDNTTPYIPVTGVAARTCIVWAKETTSQAALGGEQNLMEYGVDQSPTNTGTAFAMGIASGFNNSTGQPVGYDTFALNVQGREVQATTTPIVPGAWHMFAVVFPSGMATLGDAKLYVDGVSQTLINDTIYVPNTASGTTPLPYRVGQWRGGYGLNGAETEMSFFKSDLSASQIQSLYTVGTTGLVPEPACLGALSLGFGSLLVRRRR